MSSLNRRLGVVAIATMVSLLGLVVPASAQATPVPPVPTVMDRSGSDQDEFVIPYVDEVSYSSPDENKTYTSGEVYSSLGVSSVAVKSWYYDPSVGYYVDGPIYTLTFSLGVTGAEAANQHRITLVPGSCDRSTGQTLVRGGFYNPADSTGLYIDNVGLWLYRRPDLSGSLVPMSAKRILDGEMRTFGQQWLLPGTYRVNVQIGGQDIDMKPDVVVPNCGHEVAPALGHGSAAGLSATGSVRAANGHGKVKVVMKRAKRAKKSIFKVVVKRAEGHKKTKKYVVKKKRPKVVFRHLKPGDKVKLLVKVTKHGKRRWQHVASKTRKP